MLCTVRVNKPNVAVFFSPINSTFNPVEIILANVTGDLVSSGHQMSSCWPHFLLSLHTPPAMGIHTAVLSWGSRFLLSSSVLPACAPQHWPVHSLFGCSLVHMYIKLNTLIKHLMRGICWSQLELASVSGIHLSPSLFDLIFCHTENGRMKSKHCQLKVVWPLYLRNYWYSTLAPVVFWTPPPDTAGGIGN